MQHITFAKPTFEYLSIDMHVHSKHSHDSKVQVRDILNRAKELNIGIAITDHNAIEGSLEAGKQNEVLVIPGIEVTTSEFKDILIYFENFNELKDFYNNHVKPFIKLKKRTSYTKIKMIDLLKSLKEYKCIISIAHPFTVVPKRSFYFVQQHKYFSYIDAIEVMTRAQTKKSDLACYGFALNNNKMITAGSDAHTLKNIGKIVSKFNGKPTLKNIFSAIRNKKNSVIGKDKYFRESIKSKIKNIKSSYAVN